MQTTVANGLPETEYLDVGVNASGKLQLLDKILIEIKNRGLRVLILFQACDLLITPFFVFLDFLVFDFALLLLPVIFKNLFSAIQHRTC